MLEAKGYLEARNQDTFCTRHTEYNVQAYIYGDFDLMYILGVVCLNFGTKVHNYVEKLGNKDFTKQNMSNLNELNFCCLLSKTVESIDNRNVNACH